MQEITNNRYTWMEITVNNEDTKKWENKILLIPGENWNNMDFTIPKRRPTLYFL